MVRTFLAIDLPPAQRKALEAARRSLERAGGDVRWVPAANVHLTLKFLGGVPAGGLPRVLEAAAAACRGRAPFRLSVEGLGVFPGWHRPRVLWAGVGGDIPALAALHAAIESELAAAGFPAEERPFRPHLTLGRVRSLRGWAGVRDAMAASRLATGPFTVERVVAYESRIGPRGAAYRPLGDFPLPG
ncbi:RNA 2',3'-cyclic phosphodiesterase [Dissulfurirhabdus thermomarina]|uniref:RNA 2',3'-cyclic phosphodiesterase n=1 Tax=Dissulfurirhabdus thermomarina TaxID=1765737 RepID=A0A6N9TKJ5_DISTH|nr:RNA 2',3'-cyclic phosphodiesterase [Dissulfurirhabdus thermomarina]NDY41791.1 RNA 2',3'-cyclic phosphodiesterase [Dissulfurirhabdus thermomarina]NMX23967.1 RNA 2',3'-cyclic phosphodiesterase [Dissulfurirhabdus thermomarina]